MHFCRKEFWFVCQSHFSWTFPWVVGSTLFSCPTQTLSCTWWSVPQSRCTEVVGSNPGCVRKGIRCKAIVWWPLKKGPAEIIIQTRVVILLTTWWAYSRVIKWSCSFCVVLANAVKLWALSILCFCNPSNALTLVWIKHVTFWCPGWRLKLNGPPRLLFISPLL